MRGQQLAAVRIIETARILGLQAPGLGHPGCQRSDAVTAVLVAGLVAGRLRTRMAGPGVDGGDGYQAQAADQQRRLELVGNAEPMWLQPAQQARETGTQPDNAATQGPKVGNDGRHDRLQAEGRTCIDRLQKNFSAGLNRAAGSSQSSLLYRPQATRG
ncbi:hypothetical protein D3C73_1135900 [compost metagenome]